MPRAIFQNFHLSGILSFRGVQYRLKIFINKKGVNKQGVVAHRTQPRFFTKPKNNMLISKLLLDWFPPYFSENVKKDSASKHCRCVQKRDLDGYTIRWRVKGHFSDTRMDTCSISLSVANDFATTKIENNQQSHFSLSLSPWVM